MFTQTQQKHKINITYQSNKKNNKSITNTPKIITKHPKSNTTTQHKTQYTKNTTKTKPRYNTKKHTKIKTQATISLRQRFNMI